MEKLFGDPYRGDAGVPHMDPERFNNIWFGSFAFSTFTFFNPHVTQFSNQFNWQDKAIKSEHNWWKKALEKKNINISSSDLTSRGGKSR